jgi:hypothetical protein
VGEASSASEPLDLALPEPLHAWNRLAQTYQLSNSNID